MIQLFYAMKIVLREEKSKAISELFKCIIHFWEQTIFVALFSTSDPRAKILHPSRKLQKVETFSPWNYKRRQQLFTLPVFQSCDTRKTKKKKFR